MVCAISFAYFIVVLSTSVSLKEIHISGNTRQQDAKHSVSRQAHFQSDCYSGVLYRSRAGDPKGKGDQVHEGDMAPDNG